MLTFRINATFLFHWRFLALMQCQMVDLWSSIDCCKLPRLSWFFLYLALSVAFLPDSQFAVSALHTELLQTAQPITLLSSTFFSFEDLEYLEPLYTEFLFEWMLLQLLLLLEGSHNDRCSSCTISANSVFLLKVQTWLSRSSNQSLSVALASSSSNTLCSSCVSINILTR